GPIQAVLHGAGASRDSKFEHKDPERVEQCFRAKLDGTLALMELTRQDTLDFFVAFGSISGRFGANGHADYSMANDMMAKLVSWYRGQRPEVSSTTFHWHAWGDVGMATRAETQLGLQMVDLAFMPAHEGVEHLLRELTNGCPDPEVLITDEHYYRRFYYQEPAQPQTCPMLIGGQPSPDGFSLTLDPEQEIFLKEHRLDDTALLPMVVALELLVEAALPDSQGGCELHRVEALAGLKFHRDQPRRLQLKTDPQPSAGLRTELIAEVRAGDGTLLEAERVFFRAEVTPLTGAARPEPVAPPEGSWQPVHYHDRGARLFHGPALRALRRVQQTSTRLWGRLVSPAAVELGGTRRPTVGWRVPCAALDACLYAVGTLAWGQQPRQTVPKSIGRLRIFDQPRPREECTVEVLFLRRQEESGFFEFRLFGQQGRPLLEALDYQLQWLGSPALVARD
ncbi:MAG: polyketide synthase dehydratase domain-containing protein, partial [Candidatus Eremiobacteraeota bacterium]|nr:polyketide synthase dehydratase domain-containing protein [Candidatus Eremiobacteraeota bacterium]